MGKGLWGILIEAITSSICELFQKKNAFEADNSTYALKGLLYLDTTCHFSTWKSILLWKAFLGKYKKLNMFWVFLSLICINIYYTSFNKISYLFAFLLHYIISYLRVGSFNHPCLIKKIVQKEVGVQLCVFNSKVLLAKAY